jgi:hypothetical protein
LLVIFKVLITKVIENITKVIVIVNNFSNNFLFIGKCAEFILKKKEKSGSAGNKKPAQWRVYGGSYWGGIFTHLYLQGAY